MLITRYFIFLFIGIVFCYQNELNQGFQPSKKMTGVHLRIAVYNEPPIFTIVKDPSNATNVQYIGFAKNLFDLLSTTLDFTYSFVEVTPNMVKTKGSIDAAIIDQLLQNNADIHGRFISPTAERLLEMDFTVAVSVLKYSIIQPMPEIKNRFLASIKPFQPTVWVMIGVAYITTVIVLSSVSIFARKMEKRRKIKKFRIASDLSMYSLLVLMSQGAYLPSTRSSLRVLAGAWCLLAFVLVYAYNSTLISFITLPIYEPIVNTWEELAASESLQFAAPKGGVLTEIIMNAKTGALKTLGDSLRINPENLLLPGDTQKWLDTGKFAYVEVKQLGIIITYMSMYKNNGICKLTIGQELGFTQTVSIGVMKGLPYLSTIDKKLLHSFESGVMFYLGSDLRKSITKCVSRQADRPMDTKLTRFDLSSAFITLCFGFSLSLLVFLLELIWSKFNEKSNNHIHSMVVL